MVSACGEFGVLLSTISAGQREHAQFDDDVVGNLMTKLIYQR